MILSETPPVREAFRPETVIQLGYGSLYDKVEWVEGEFRESGRFLEMRRGFFFKASYLWRL